MNYESVGAFFKTLSLSKILPAALFLLVGLIAAKLLSKLFSKMLQHSRLEKSMHAFLNTLFKVLIYSLVILLASSALGINTSSLIALFSVLTLAISLAVQGTLSNVAGGVQVLTAHPFKVDDFVEIGSVMGTVQEIGPMYTTLISMDGKQVNIPNSAVATSTVINYSALGKRRVDLQFSASYDSDPDAVLSALRKAGQVDGILDSEGVFASILSYEDSAIKYVLRVWVKPADYWDVYFGIIDRVHRCFQETGVVMTYPHLNVHLDR